MVSICVADNGHGWSTPGCVSDLMRMNLARPDFETGKHVLTVAGLLLAGVDDWQERLTQHFVFGIQVR